LTRIDGPWLRQKLGIVVLIKTGPAAELLSWQQHNRCRFVSFVINISGVKFEKHCFYISRDILYSVFPNLHNSKNVNISKTKKDIPKRKMSLLFFWKSLSNKLQLFLMS